MSAEAPPAVREGFCDLPEVPGVPNLASDAMLAIMAAVEPADVEVLRRSWLRLGAGEGDEAAIDEVVMDVLMADEQLVTEGLRIFSGEEIAHLCAERGWPPDAQKGMFLRSRLICARTVLSTLDFRSTLSSMRYDWEACQVSSSDFERVARTSFR